MSPFLKDYYQRKKIDSEGNKCFSNFKKKEMLTNISNQIENQNVIR